MNVFDKVKQAFTRRDAKALDEALEEMQATSRRSSTADRAMSDADLEERFKGLEEGQKKMGDRVGDVADRVSRMYDKLMGDMPPWLMEKGGEKPGEKQEEKTEDVGEGINSQAAGSTSGSSILNQLEMEAPPGTNDAARKARDSRYLEDSYQDTLALAEILVPGIDAPAFQVTDKPAKSVSTICNFRKKVLDAALTDDATKEIVHAIAGEGFDPKKCSCADARSVFRAAGAMKRAANNAGFAKQTGDEQIMGPGGGLGIRSKLKTIAEINARNREYYKTH